MGWQVNSFAFILLVLGTTTALINTPPRIVKEPPTDEILFEVPIKVSKNIKPFLIECEAQGNPEPKYRWTKNRKPFNWQAYDNRMFQQPGRGTIVVTSPKDEDSGQYQCFAENEFGIATSNSVFVRKVELNAFEDANATPIEITANEGAPFQLQCEPPNGWPKPTINWLIQYSDGRIKSINNSRMTVDPEGNLWFSNVTREDASDDFYYACSATSAFNNEYKIGNRVLLNVVPTDISPGLNKHEPKRQYVSRKSISALKRKTIELFCIFGGTPLPQIVWKKDGRDIHWNDRVTQGNYGKSLVIRHVDSEDHGGPYTCKVSNGVGNAQSYDFYLRVLSIPYFTVEPEIQNAAEGEEVVFKCEASGVPEPTIQWIHNGEPIEVIPQNPRRTVQNNQIIIRNLEKGDTGNYGCNATNSVGYVYKDVYLNVFNKQNF